MIRSLSTALVCITLVASQSHAAFAQDRSEPVPKTANTPVGAYTSPVVSSPILRAGEPASIIAIGDGDLLEVSLYGIEDYRREVRVSGEGEITLPMIGSVKVRGLSPTEAQLLIANRLRDGRFFKNPQVQVIEKELATQGVSVLGEVQKPGVYPILGPRKLFDLISAAGGMATEAGPEILITHRSDPGNAVSVALSDNPKKSMESNVKVFAGDTVVVSRAGIVYVVGDVRLPGGFVLQRGKDLTILQALALAQGANSMASLDHSKLIRKTQDGVMKTPIYLKKILEGKVEDMNLRADDILFVPHNGTKEMTAKSLQTIIQTATGIAIYRF